MGARCAVVGVHLQQAAHSCACMQVDFNAKNEYDMINNYKVMQDVFNKLGVEKVCAQLCRATADSTR